MRPEEERSQSETTPEITGVRQQATSPLERAQALVTQWEAGLTYAWRDQFGVEQRALVFTNDVRDRLRDDIVRLLEQTIALEHNAR